MLAPDGGADGGASSVHQAAARGISVGGGKLPDGDKIQQSFGGYDISNIQAHLGGTASEASQAMGADAYATGNHVVLSDRGKDLHTQAHEATHVVQQQAGVSLSGGVGQAGDRYEKQADDVADAVVAGKSAEGLLGQIGGGGGAGGSGGVQMREEDPTAPVKTRTVVKEKEKSESTEETDIETEETIRARVVVETRSVEFDKCKSETDCAALLHKIAGEAGCSPGIIKSLWRKTEAGIVWEKRRRAKLRRTTKSEREKTTETTADVKVAPETPEVCAPADLQKVREKAEDRSLAIAQGLSISALARNSGFNAAVNIIQNDMIFANEFDATPNFKKAVGKAIFGDVNSWVRKATNALTTGPGKALGGYIFATVDALVAERTRALTARKDKTVRDVFNTAIGAEVAKLDDSLSGVFKTPEFIQSLRVALEGSLRVACDSGEDSVDALARLTMEYTATLDNTFGFAGVTVAGDGIRDALKALIVGLTAGGHIDHGNVSISARRSGAGYSLGEIEVENKPPILRVGARSGALADAITQYITRFGGSINMLPIEKRVKVTVRFTDLGFIGTGYFMDGTGSWTKEGDAGNASIHPVHLLKMKPHGDLEELHFDTWKRAKNLVGPHLERHRVGGEG